MMKMGIVIMLVLLNMGNFAGASYSIVPVDNIPGIIKMSAIWDDTHYLMLFNERVQEDIKKAPINYDVIGIYDETTQQVEIIYRDKNIWQSYDDQLYIKDGNIVYNNNLECYVLDEKGLIKKYDYDCLRAYSPKNNQFVERRSDELAVIDEKTGEVLSTLKNIKSTTQMKWNENTDEIAIVTDSNSNVIVWDWENNTTKKYITGKNLKEPEGWVSITRVNFVRNTNSLIIEYLCETGISIIIWDIQGDRYCEVVTVEGEGAVLDAGQKGILYEEKLEKSKIHLLHFYNFQTGEDKILDEFEGVYTIGCLLRDEKHILVNKWDLERKTNAIEKLSI